MRNVQIFLRGGPLTFAGKRNILKISQRSGRGAIDMDYSDLDYACRYS